MSKIFSFFFLFFFFIFLFYNELHVSNYLFFLCLTDKTQVNPRISLINISALNYLLRSQIFVNDDGQLQATHLILDYEPLLRSFLDVGNAIRANDYRLARIDVSRPNFLAPYNLLPVDHPISQGVPLVAQPIQQVSLGQAVPRKGLHLPLRLRKKLTSSNLKKKKRKE